jgi:hypothetical protein
MVRIWQRCQIYFSQKRCRPRNQLTIVRWKKDLLGKNKNGCSVYTIFRRTGMHVTRCVYANLLWLPVDQLRSSINEESDNYELYIALKAEEQCGSALEQCEIQYASINSEITENQWEVKAVGWNLVYVHHCISTTDVAHHHYVCMYTLNFTQASSIPQYSTKYINKLRTKFRVHLSCILESIGLHIFNGTLVGGRK